MFLLVYVHSRMHDDTDTFVRGLLCRQELLDFVNENFMCFLGSINKPEAFAFAQSLGITGDSIAFPTPHTLMTQSSPWALHFSYCMLLFPPFFLNPSFPPQRSLGWEWSTKRRLLHPWRSCSGKKE